MAIFNSYVKLPEGNPSKNRLPNDGYFLSASQGNVKHHRVLASKTKTLSKGRWENTYLFFIKFVGYIVRLVDFMFISF